MLDFSKGLVVSRTYFVEYYMGHFYIKDGDNRIPIYDSNNVGEATVLYSRPINKTYPDWHEKELSYPIKPENREAVNRYWARYKPGLEVTGKIEEGVFYEDTGEYDARNGK